MERLRLISKRIDQINSAMGRAASWLLVAMTIITVLVVILRYFFNLGWIWLQDSVLYMHGACFMLTAAYALLQGEHVRVDIFYHPANPVRKARIDILGYLFLMVPTCGLILYFGWGYVASSWQILEGSKETGGLPGVFLLKTTILLFPLMLLSQGLSMSIKAWDIIREGKS